MPCFKVLGKSLSIAAHHIKKMEIKCKHVLNLIKISELTLSDILASPEKSVATVLDHQDENSL